MRKKVLIVDDNQTNLYMLETLLKGYGMEVTSAENGREALEKARRNPPDLIVTDILMPVMDGYTLCRHWKSDNALKHIPLVFYTATYTEPKDEEFALSLGADRFVVKPQEPDQLMNMIKEVLEENYVARRVAARPLGEEMEFFRRHNEILFSKLEKKMLDLEIANQKLRLSEECYRLSFRNVSDVIYTMDKDLHIVSMSPSVEKILGYKPQEFIGRTVSDLGRILIPESFEQVLSDISLILKGETIPAAVYRFITKDGAVKYGEVSVSAIVREGEIIGIVSVARDITERRRVEDALIESERKYRDLYDFLPIPVYEMDLEGNIISGNRAIYETFGGTEEDLKKGFKAWQILSPEEIEKSSKNIKRLLAGEQVRGTEYTLKRLDGSVFPAIVVSRVIYRDGKPVGLRGAIVDITQRKRAEKDLENSRNMLIRSEKLAAIGQLSAGVAHEILNPVNIMGMRLQMLEMTEALSEKTKEAVRTCEEQIKRITKITRDLQQFARVSEKQITPSNINELIEQVLSLMGPRLKIEGVNVDARYQADLTPVPLDKDRMGQVILNLINNALDAMKGRPARTLRVVTELTDKGHVRLCFSDTGSGIPDEILPRIFDPFFTTKEAGKGTGLGLSISYGITQDHNGTIRAENNEQGGATFIVELPVA